MDSRRPPRPRGAPAVGSGGHRANPDRGGLGGGATPVSGQLRNDSVRRITGRAVFDRPPSGTRRARSPSTIPVRSESSFAVRQKSPASRARRRVIGSANVRGTSRAVVEHVSSPVEILLRGSTRIPRFACTAACHWSGQRPGHVARGRRTRLPPGRNPPSRVDKNLPHRMHDGVSLERPTSGARRARSSDTKTVLSESSPAIRHESTDSHARRHGGPATTRSRNRRIHMPRVGEARRARVIVGGADGAGAGITVPRRKSGVPSRMILR